MKCPKCNKPNDGNGQFCEYCGANLEAKTNALDSFLKICLMLGFFLISISLAYYFLYRPFKKQANTKECYNKSINLVGWDGKGEIPLYKNNDFKIANDLCMIEKGW